MSGGNKTQMAPSVSDPVAASQPAYLQGTSPATMSAGMPGQIAALAQQLAAGYGGTPASFAAELNKAYQPAKTLDFTKAGTAPKTSTAGLGATPGTTKPVDRWMGMGPLAYTRMTAKPGVR